MPSEADDRARGESDVGLAETVPPEHAPTRDDTPVAEAKIKATGQDLGARPEADKLARDVARAKIAGALFQTEERVKLGRYQLLELVGSGGMGVVWGAWDPELDRRVAIKLVKTTVQSARDRILLEGQALAKLSHPNVVPVYDVGVVDEQVYLVMEWVHGFNLRAYGRDARTVRELVAVYKDAALGLAAAHHAGLIHRDFKPDNAIRGDDGRVRVLDFGLAREGVKKQKAVDGDDTPVPSSDLTRGAGTPRYMPPEQAEGGTLTPAVDQYAFCVSLREALVGRNADGKNADVPGWLDKIVSRGTAADAKGRYRSMDELLRALARDPATVWRRRLIAGGAIGAAAAAFLVGNVSGAGEPEACVGGTAEIAAIWADPVHAKMLDHLSSLGPFAKEEANRIGIELRDYGDAWAKSHHDACMAHERKELTQQIYERTVGCLARSRVALTTVVDVLSTTAADGVPDALVAARRLPDARRCVTEAALSNVALPPPQVAQRADVVGGEIERARVLAIAHHQGADDEAANALAHASALGYLPLIARANLAHGLAEMTHHPVRGFEPFARATRAALEAGDPALAVEAYARAVSAVGTSPPGDRSVDANNALSFIDFMEPLALGLRPAGALQRALLYMHMGIARSGAGDPLSARRWFEKARDEVRAGAIDDIELEGLPFRLAMAADTGQERETVLAASVGRLKTALGPNHPLTLNATITAAQFTHDPQRAAEILRDGCDGYRTFFPDENFMIADCLYETGWLANERGDDAETRSAMIVVSTEDTERGKVARGFVAVLDGDAIRAAPEMERLSRDVSVAPWSMGYVADAALVCGVAWERAGKPTAAIPCLTRNLALLEDYASKFPVGERRLARARTLLARSLAENDPAQARALARAALTWYRSGTGYDAVIAELERVAGP